MRTLKRVFAGIVAVSFAAAVAIGTDGEVTQTATSIGSPVVHTFTWKVVGAGTNFCNAQGTIYVRGEILRVVFDPTTYASGSRAAISNYTITATDSSGVDILGGQGASMSTITVVSIRPSIVMSNGLTTNLAPFAVNDLLTIAVTNSGTNASGTLKLYVK